MIHAGAANSSALATAAGVDLAAVASPNSSVPTDPLSATALNTVL
jgi:hypothetical protein